MGFNRLIAIYNDIRKVIRPLSRISKYQRKEQVRRNYAVLKSKQEQQEAREYLRSILPPGTKVYAEIAHVSRSGMMRHVRLFAVVNGELENITWHSARAMGDKPFDNNFGQWVLKMGGCGMDMGFAAVYGLSSALYGRNSGSAFHCIGKGDGHTYGTQCPSNDHSNDWREHGDRDRTDLWDAERVHSDGGYALRHSSL